MSTFTANLLQQKIMEIRRSLPTEVLSQFSNSPTASDSSINTDFQNVLNATTTDLENSATTSVPSGTAIKSPAELEEFINAASKKYNISPKVIKAVIKAESSFDSNCVSSSGAMGLMQLMPATAKGLGVKDAYDPAQNIDGGVKYLSYQLKRFDGNLEYALAAYNAGPGAVIKYGGIPPYDETQNYVKKIMGWINN